MSPINRAFHARSVCDLFLVCQPFLHTNFMWLSVADNEVDTNLMLNDSLLQDA